MTRATASVVRVSSAIFDPKFKLRHRKHPSCFTRQRKLTFDRVVGTILSLAKKSLQIECNLLGDRVMDEPASKQAFSKARHNISYTGFKALNEEVLDEAYTNDATGLWFGYRVFGIDGSLIRVPASLETITHFGRFGGKSMLDPRFPVMARISQVVELTTGITVSAAIDSCRVSERDFAMDHVKEVTTFFHNRGQHKQVFVFDRGYPSHKLIEAIIDRKADFLFRIPKLFNQQIDKLVAEGCKTKVIQILPHLPPLRLIVRTLPSSEKCILLTSITTEEISTDNLFRLYWLRWTGCEEGYKKQKVQLELENFSGNSVEAVLQEFWATVLVLNLFVLHCVDDEGPWDPESPPEHRINRSVVFGSLRHDLFSVATGEMSGPEFQAKFTQIANRNRLKIRPNRHFSRAKANMPRTHHIYRRTC